MIHRHSVRLSFTYVAFVLISNQAKDKLPTLSSGDFIGREVMVYEIIQLLLEKRKRLVTLYGERDVGKSSVAAAVCRMLIDRVEMTWFTGGIIYFDASASRGYPSFHDGLQVQTVAVMPALPCIHGRSKCSLCNLFVTCSGEIVE